MGVDMFASLKVPMPDDMARTFMLSSAVVNKVGAPESSWPSPRKCDSEVGKKFQSGALWKAVGFGASRSPVKAVEVEVAGSSEVVPRSAPLVLAVVDNAKSQSN
jgi:hypothetical protein